MHMQGKTTKQFMLAPGHLDFGSVKLGQVQHTCCIAELCSLVSVATPCAQLRLDMRQTLQCADSKKQCHVALC